MTKKRRTFDIDLPEAAEDRDDAPLPQSLERNSLPLRRGPMATAIGETAGALRERAVVEADIRAENDALAHEFVRLKKLGLVVDRIAVDQVSISLLTRDRSQAAKLDLGELKGSIRSIGLSNPIRVVADGSGGYELVQGLRRLSAYRELLAETGDSAYATIPAGLMPPGDGLDVLYRRMVDENLIRQDVSFAEMANLARAYAENGIAGCADLDEAVNKLFASASPQKRSYVRRFAGLMRTLEKQIKYPYAIPRALGLDLADRVEADPGSVVELTAMLRASGQHDAATEIDVLRRFAERSQMSSPPKVRGAPRGVARRGRVSLTVPVGPGVRATATAGKMELRADLDFGALDRNQLEQAIAAFFEVLTRR